MWQCTDNPEIFCGPTSISVSFATQNRFAGIVFVKGRHAEVTVLLVSFLDLICLQDACATHGDNSRAQGEISLGFDECGLQRERSVSDIHSLLEKTRSYNNAGNAKRCFRHYNSRCAISPARSNESRPCVEGTMLLYGGR